VEWCTEAVYATGYLKVSVKSPVLEFNILLEDLERWLKQTRDSLRDAELAGSITGGHGGADDKSSPALVTIEGIDAGRLWPRRNVYLWRFSGESQHTQCSNLGVLHDTSERYGFV
jgi:hypothetical protein